MGIINFIRIVSADICNAGRWKLKGAQHRHGGYGIFCQFYAYVLYGRAYMTTQCEFV